MRTANLDRFEELRRRIKMAKSIPGLNTQQKHFITLFRSITHRHQSWQVWSDFIFMAACAISRIDKKSFDKREAMYMDTIKRYDEKEQRIFPQLFAVVVVALEADPEQDFMGVLFQLLELSSHWHGQFFTPYSVCKMMAEMQMTGISDVVREKGYVSVNDPACGAGALLIAFANAARSKGVDYQNHVLFVAQDIDRTAALMSYIQLSLLGCSGYIVVADTLRHPVVTAETEVWYTPWYFSEVWHWRRLFKSFDHMLATEVVPKDSETSRSRMQVSLANKAPDELVVNNEVVQLVLL